MQVLTPTPQVLELAMGLPGVRSSLSTQQSARMTRRVIEPQLHERATIYLLLAQCLSRLSSKPDVPEAKKVITWLHSVNNLCPMNQCTAATTVASILYAICMFYEISIQSSSQVLIMLSFSLFSGHW